MTDAPTVRDERFREIAYRRSAEPRAFFHERQARGPFVHGETERGNPELLSREGVEFVLRNPDLFSSAMGIMGSAEPPIPIGIDPPQHAEYRKLLDPAFSPRRMAALQPTVAAHTHGFIDAFIDRGECDFSQELSVPLPGSTFLDLLGVPQTELPKLLHWKDVMIHNVRLGGGVEGGLKLLAETVPQIYAYLYQVIAERRDQPADDVISRLLDARLSDGRLLSDNEIARTLFLFISAGLDTVSVSLQCIFNFLATNPEARQMLVDEPDTTDNLIEELLRWESPVQSVLPRTATQDVEVLGCPFKKGEVVDVLLGAANIDPAVPGADTVDVRSGNKRHLAFGAGPHRCLGSHLARMELRTVVREWHKRIPNYRLKEGYVPEWNAHFVRGVDHLMLEWDKDEVNR
ncbi:cytochrome P450 [Nocardioides sp. cx-173]|uniref:cytochrome P450 n=1 Tax=Nocardioides sp. cx-173 TaxID=2898796 RepID=UPI001E28BBDC|nr:cytochrome P450 [Nocardioides sp. cx-173]MCD4524286.1 cytochrome P450 [Nocardioides sp. cx-173]UGB41678.1 cytochrome P450 [Nocardioides sp. cx-173]